jgi:hypothetical protein
VALKDRHLNIQAKRIYNDNLKALQKRESSTPSKKSKFYVMNTTFSGNNFSPNNKVFPISFIWNESRLNIPPIFAASRIELNQKF